MSTERQEPWISPEEYLEGEKASPVKHEYIDGQVFAMAGASTAHGLVAGNLFALIHGQLRGTPCRAFIADMKARIEASNVFYYPDILVTCDPDDRQNDDIKKHPRLIVEVLSRATPLFDPEGKFLDYQKLESLQQYVLVSQDLMRVEIYRRQESEMPNIWEYSVAYAGDPIRLASVNLVSPIEQIYENVEFSPNEETPLVQASQPPVGS